ncbi:ATP phosphoribosyltransferase-domain-containing protein [Cercophora scortea]|uniref:ATP phosphoribosyltransferase n=1 Tax=Cercophora scortea TaxID=314031 RepID=A0AAE0J5T5_9PEZI|nr:ATP phosphoribosyltransferase-domain-containing protein [Cercophora scortea]
MAVADELISLQSLEGRLLFAVPKKGRLLSASLNLLEGADIQFRRENRLDIALVKNLPIALVFLPRPTSPPSSARVASTLVSRASTRCRSMMPGGEELSPEESAKPQGCETVMELGFGACRLQVQVPAKGGYAEGKDLIGKNIGTSFVHLAEEYFARLELEKDGLEGVTNGDGGYHLGARKLRTKIIELSGSVEAACALGVADGIVDLVESGETMKAAGLKAIDTVVDSSAILIKSKAPSNPAMVDLIAARIGGVITAQRYVLCQYNIPRTRLADASKITPGKRAPTITTLDEEGWVAVSVMVEKKRIAPAMDELMLVGATDILVLDIHNTRGS